MESQRPRFPNKFVVLGVSMILVGGVLLLWTSGYLHGVSNLWPVVPLMVGLLLFYFGLFRGGPDYYVFAATSLVLAGVLLLVTTTLVPVTLGYIWPLFMTIIGAALLAYGFRKTGYTRLSLTVPGAAMVVLSGVFLPFSLGLVSVEFSRFVSVWWPVVFVILGVVLTVTHVRRRRQPDR